MKKIEDILNSKKEELNMVEAPHEMEDCLRSALRRKRRRIPKGAIAAALIAVLMFAYSFDALAYYGKKIMGYDNVLNGSLKKLTEEGRGQEINKSCTFSNGVEVTLDGIMFDDNELVAFYKMRSTGGKLNYSGMRLSLSGIKPLGYNHQSGQGTRLDDYSMVFIDTFEPPGFYEKWMKFNMGLTIDGKIEEKSISFTLDRNRAMIRTVRKELNEKVRVGDYNVLLDTLTVSSMSTYIEGRMEALTERAKEGFKGDIASKDANGFNSIESPHLKFDFVTDRGEAVEFYESRVGSSMDKISFANKGEALPEEFNTLEMKNIRLESHKLVDKSVDITPETVGLKVDDDFIIKKVYFEGDTTCVVASSRGMPIMGLFIDDKHIQMIDTGLYDGKTDSEKAVDRTFKFEGKAKKMRLDFKYIRYSVYSSEIVSIPVE